MTVKNTEVNHGLEVWRGSNATCDNNKGQHRVRMQYLAQPKQMQSHKRQCAVACGRLVEEASGISLLLCPLAASSAFFLLLPLLSSRCWMVCASFWFGPAQDLKKASMATSSRYHSHRDTASSSRCPCDWAEIKRAVFRDTTARLETRAFDAHNGSHHHRGDVARFED